MVSQTDGFNGSKFETLESRVLLTGAFPSAATNAIVYDARGNLDVAYYDSTAHNLKFVQQAVNGTWSTPIVVDGSSSDEGKYLAIGINKAGFPAIAYQDSANSDLKFAQYNGTSWTTTVVDKRKTTGFNPSLAFDSTGTAYISYYKQNTGDLDLATLKSGPKQKWTVATLQSAGNVGQYSSIAINPSTNKPSVAYTNAAGSVQYVAKNKSGFAKPVTVGAVSKGTTGSVSLAFNGTTASVGFVNTGTGAVDLGTVNGKKFATTTVATVTAGTGSGAQVLIDPTTHEPAVVYHDSTGVYIADKDSDGNAQITEVQTGGSNTIAAVQPGSGSIVFSTVSTTGGTLSVNTTVSPPTAPGNVAAAATSSTTATVTWTDNSNNEAGFLIERSTDGTTFTSVATTQPNITSLDDTGLTEGTLYYYRVSAIGAAGNNSAGTTSTAGGQIVAAAGIATATTLPAAPTGVSAAPASASGITVTWTNASRLLTGFLINRSADDGATWTQAGSVGVNAVSFNDSGLNEGSAYNYQVIAYNASGGSTSASAATDTLSASPTGVTATAVSDTAITVTWTNASASVGGFLLQRSTDGANFATIFTADATTTSYADTGLTESSAYYYRVEAIGPGGFDSAPSTTGNAVTNPTAPSNVSLSAQSSSRIDVSWTNNSTGATGYNVQRSADGGAFVTIANINDAGTTSFSDANLTEGIAYTYRVQATENGSTSAFSAQVSSATLPGTPTGLSAVASGLTVTLTWNDNSTNETGFQVQRSADNGSTWSTLSPAPAANSTSTATYVDHSAGQGATYTYRVRAVNAAGASAYTNTAHATIAPAAPSGLTAVAASATAINLSWTDNSLGETGIIVERSTDNITWQTLTTTAAFATGYPDTGLTAGTTYLYRISATNAGGPSTYATATGLTAPLAPSSITATAASTTEIDLSWAPVSSATSYIIQRTLNGTTTTLNPISNTTFADTLLAEGTQYRYTVTAVNAGGSSVAGGPSIATTLPAAPINAAASGITATSVLVTWQNNSQGYNALLVQRSGDGGQSWTTVASPAPGQTSITDSGVSEANTYIYQVQASNAGGPSAFDVTAPVTTVPAAPTALTATAAGASSVVLNWTNNSSGATGYVVQRGTDGENFPISFNVDASAQTYTDTTAASATNYYYRVYANGTGGPSDYSNNAQSTTVPAAPQNVVATPVSATVVGLTWNPVTGASSYTIARSVDGGAYLPYDASATNSYTDLGAIESTAYSYTIDAINGTGSSVDSDASTPIITIPSAPSGVTVASATASQVVVNWTNTSHAVVGFTIERSDDNGTSFSQVGTALSTDTAYTDTQNIVEGSHYIYRIRAVGVGGPSAPSNTAGADTNPAAPSNLTTSATSATTITVSWADVSGHATGYVVSRSDNGGAFNVQATLGSSAASFNDTVSEDGSYRYQVRAIQLLGDNVTTLSSTWTGPQPVATGPATPTSVQATVISASEVDVTWVNNSPTATSFNIFRSNAQSEYDPIGSVTAGSPLLFQDFGASAGTQYTYQVVAVGPNGQSAATTSGALTSIPPVPANVVASTASNPQIVVTWDDVPGETGFSVERNDGNGWGAPVAVAQGITTYTDLTSVEDVMYQYRVLASNSSGSSAYSDPVSASTFLAAPTGVTITSTTSGEVDLSWTDHSVGATNYEVQRSDNGGAWQSLTTSLSNAATSYQDTSVLDGVSYAYQVRALSVAGNSDFAASSSTTTPLLAPTGLTPTSVSTTRVDLTWTNPSATATSYQIWRSIGGADYSQIDTVSVTSYTDAALSAGQTALYEVIAANAITTSAASNIATGVARPASPSGLDVEPIAGSATSLSLTWTDNSTGATGYQVYRDDGGGFSLITTVPGANANSYTDTGLTEGSAYTYKIFAVNDGGESGASNSFSNTTYCAAPTGLTVSGASATSIDLEWTDTSNNASGYTVAISTDGGTSFTPIPGSNVLGPTDSTFTVTGLTEATQYEFQVYAYNVTGNSLTSNSLTATTVPSAPTLNYVAAYDAGPGMGWTNNSATLPAFTIERSSDGGATFPTTFDVPSGTISYSDTSAEPNTSYVYRIVAKDAGGASAPSTTRSVLTLPADPTNFAVTSTSSTSATLTWTADAHGTGSYAIYRSAEDGFDSIGSALGTDTSFTDTGAAAGATYVYEIVPVNSSGSPVAVNSSPVSILTDAPTGLTSTSVTATTVALQWSDVQGETGFVLQRSPDGSSWQTIDSPTTGQTTYTDTGLTEGTTYYYQIAGSNSSGTGDYSASYSILTTPAAPTGLTTSPVSATQVNLSWTDNAASPDGYDVYRAANGGAAVRIAHGLAPDATTYQDTGATGGSSYVYSVSAYNATGSSTPATQTALTVPGQPQSLMAIGQSSSEIDLSWNSVFGASQFTIERSPNGTDGWQQLDQVDSSTLAYQDTGLTEGTTYYYTVTASNNTGSGAAASVNGPTLPTGVISLTVTGTSATAVELNWTNNSVGATGYHVYRQDNNAGQFNLVDTINDPAVTTFDDTVTEGTAYTYRVLPFDVSGDGVVATDISITTIPATPTLTAATPASNTTVDLSWINNSASATGFTVERAPFGSSNWTMLASALDGSAVGYSDTTVAGGTEYQYKVIAQGAGGDSADSNVIDATTYADAVTTVSANAASTTEIDLTWTASTGATGYDILRSTTNGNFMQVDSVGAGATSYQDTDGGNNLTEGTTYYYQVAAVNGAGSSATGNTAHNSTWSLAPSGLTLTAVSNSQIDMSWTNNSASFVSNGIEISTDGSTWMQAFNTGNDNTSTYDSSGLSSGTTYYYRVSAIDAGGTNYMSDVQSVSTMTLADAPTLTATAATDGTVSLNWTATTGAATYTVQHSSGGAFSDAIAGTADTSATDTGLTGNTNYQYQILATDAGGDGAYSTPISVLTVPDAPTSVVATPSGPTTVGLAWSGDAGANVKYSVYRAPVSGGNPGSFVKIGSVTGALTYSDTTASSGTAYAYEVFASNASGQNVTPGFSNQTTTFPAAVTSLTQSVVSTTEVDLTWADSVGATSYTVSRVAPGDMSYTLLTGSPLSSSATSYNDITALAGTSYTYKVTAINASGSTSATIDALTFPDAPTGLTVSVTDNHDISIQWNAVTGADSYTLQRSIDSGDWVDVTSYSGTSLTDVVAGGNTYAYQVKATDATGDSAFATASSVTTVPDAVAGVSATAVSDASIHIAWNLTNGATGYVVERSDDNGSTYPTSSMTLASSATSYDDTGLSEMTPYKYKVVALNTAGNAADSSVVSIVTLPTAPSGLETTNVTASEVDLSWTDNSNGLAGFDVQRNDGGWHTIDTTGAGVTTYQDTTVSPATNYSYRIIADNGSVASAPTAALPVLTVPDVVQDVTATAVSTTEIDLTWTADSGSIANYRVMESTGGSYSQVGSDLPGSATSDDVTGLTAATAYQFEVLAVNATGASVATGFTGKYWADNATRPDLIPGNVPPTFTQTDQTINIGSDPYESTDGMNSVPGAPADFGVSDFVAEWTGTVRAQYSEQYTFYLSTDDGSRLLINGQVVGNDNFYTEQGQTTEEIDLPDSFVAGQTYNIEVEYQQGGGGWDARLEWSSPSLTREFVNPTTSVNATTLAETPAEFAATGISASEVDLSWDASTGATGYMVERQNPDSSWSTVAADLPSNAVSYQDTSLDAGTSYTYRVEALDAGGQSVATDPEAGLTLVAPPTNVVATPISTTEVELAWDAMTGADTYDITYSINGGMYNSLTTGVATNSYTFSAASAGHAYLFKIYANDATGASLPGTSNSALTIPAVPAGFAVTATDATEVDMSWTASTGASGYVIERAVGAGTYSPLDTSSLTGTSTSFDDTTAQPGTTYNYRIHAVNATGPSATSGVQSALTVPSAVSILGTTVVSDSEIALAWTADTGTVTGYEVLREDNNSGNFVQIGDTLPADTTSFDDTGLANATDYVYRVLAANDTGTSADSDTNTLTTTPAAPTDFAATSISSAEIDLSWTDSPGATGYQVQRNDGDGYAAIGGVLADNAVSYQDTAVDPGTSYSYRVEAIDAGGDSDFATPQTAETRPDVVANFTASTTAGDTVNLAWDTAIGATSYTILKYDGMTYTSLATQAGTTYSDSSLDENTAYSYEIVATDAGGDGAATSNDDVTTLLNSPTVAVSNTTNTSTKLTWTDHSAAETAYKVEQLIDGSWTDIDDAASLDNTGSTDNFIVSGLTEATAYSFHVTAVSGADNDSTPTDVTVYTAPNAPSPFSVTHNSATSIVVAWTDQSANNDSYQIDRSDDTGMNWTPLATPAAGTTSYTDSTVAEATAYEYRISALFNGSASTYATTSATTVPLAASGLGSTAISATEIDLSWTDNSAGATAYRVYHSTDGQNYTQVGSDLASDATSFQDMSAAENFTTYYVVAAVDAGGESAWTDPTSATTPLAAPSGVTASTTTDTTTGDKTVDLSWTNNSTVATSVKIERGVAGVYTPLATVDPGVSTYVDDSGLENTAYTYRAYAVDGGVTSTHTASNTMTTLLSRPTGLTVSSPTATSVLLTWNDVSAAATSYHIERSDDGMNFSDIGAVLDGSANTYTDTGLTEGTVYYYQVRAKTGSNTSNYTDQQTVTTIPATPTSLAASPFSTTEIDLTWNDNSPTNDSYTVERSDDNGVTWSPIAVGVDGAATTYSDTGLTEATDHQYEVFAIGDGGNSADSNESSATTLPNAPTGLTLSASSASAVTINWTENSAGATAYEVQRFTSGSWVSLTTSLAANATSYTDSSVTEGTSYQYQVRAIRNGTDSAFSNALSVTTQPAAPSNLAVSSFTSSRVTLTWTDNSSGETGYTVERSTDGVNYSIVGTPGANSTSFSDNTVTEGVAYSYYVFASNSGGNSTNSGTVSANIPPAAPTGLTSSNISGSSVTLTWTNNSAHQTGFFVERSTDGGSTYTQIANVISGLTYTDSTVSEASSYVYRVRAYGTTGNSAYSGTKSVNTPVNTPTNLATTVVSTTEIDLTWTDNSAHEQHYSLQRSTDGGITWSTTITLAANTTSYHDTGLSEGTTYTYQLQATTTPTSKNSAFTSAQSATTLPATPSGVTATVNSDTQVTVTWTNNSVGTPGAAGFTIQRQVGDVWLVAGTVGAGISTFTDTGLSELTTYSYRVEATNVGGNSAWANASSSATTLPSAPSNLTLAAPSVAEVDLTWTDNSHGATAYSIERNDNAGSGWVVIATTGASATTYADVTVNEAADYSYRVRTVSNALNSAYSNAPSITTVPLDPDTLAATTVSTSQINLTWNDNSAGATHYLVERGADGGNTFTQIASLNGTAASYSDTDLTEGFSYQYQVRAQDAGGYSGYTDSVEATTLPAAPSGLVATPSAGQIALTWVDNSNGESSYTVQHNNSGTWTTIASLAADSTGFTDTGATGGLSSGTTYQYRVFCTTGDGGNSANATGSGTAV